MQMGMWPSGEGSKRGAGRRGFDHRPAPASCKAAPNGASKKTKNKKKIIKSLLYPSDLQHKYIAGQKISSFIQQFNTQISKL